MTGHDDDGDLLFESLKAGICSSLLGAGVGILKVIWSDNPRVPSANIPFQKVENNERRVRALQKITQSINDGDEACQ